MNRPARIPELDGIRGLAIAGVLVFHYFTNGIAAPPASFLAYAQAATRLTGTGVDLFFVLSGFLIGGILLDSRDSPDYFRAFYTHRFFRIVPIYVIVLAAAYAFVKYAGPEADKVWSVTSGPPFFSYWLYLQNFWMAARNNLGFFAATWSLAIEEQFYLLLPAIVRFVNPRHFPAVLGVGIVGAPLLRAAALHAWPGNFILPLAITPCRADALLLGVAGAWMMRNARARASLERNPRTLLAALAIGVLGAGFWTVYRQPEAYVVLGYSWMALTYLALILVGVTRASGPIAAILRWRLLRGLGAIAYGVYLLHQWILVAVAWAIDRKLYVLLVDERGVLLTVAALALTLALCALSWIFFEKPLVDFGHRQTISLHS